jgi:hypothetical protein
MGSMLAHVKNQTPEICLAAVNANSFAIKFVKNQTNFLCIHAVKQNGCALVFVYNPNARNLFGSS